MLMFNKFQIALFSSKLRIAGILMKKGIKHFKIGKTSQPLKDRFDHNYQARYSQIKLVYQSNDLKLIDSLEKELIAYFKKYNANRCDNDQLGGGPDCEGDIGYIYIVF